MSKIIGTFYFKLTTHGNLIGEFTNNNSEEVMTEAATLLLPSDRYVGTYSSIWFDVSSQNLELVISKPKIKYILRWMNNQVLVYYGEGILVDDILIGYYKKM